MSKPTKDEETPKPVAAEVDPDAVELSEADHARIRAKAKAQVAAERKKALEAKALEAALEEIRGKAGLVTGNPEEDRIVNITIDCGENSDGITVNGVKRFHGRTYEVPLHVARSLQEIMFRSQSHEHDISGKGRSEFYRRPRHVALTRRNQNAVEQQVARGTGAAA